MSDRAVDLLDRTETPTTAARIASWIRVAEVTFVALVLLALSFVLGRVSSSGSRVVPAQTGQTAPAGLSPQAERAAQARLAQANPTEVRDSGHNLLSICLQRVPC